MKPNYTVYIYQYGIPVRKHEFVYKERMEIVLRILNKYYNSDNIVIEDMNRNRGRYTNYY